MSDPNNIPQSSLGYIPNKPLALFAGSVFFLLSIALVIHLIRGRHWWGLCLPIGTLALSGGFGLRFAVVLNQFSLGLFIASDLLIIISPATFLAFNYIVYGRLIQTFSTGQTRHSLIRPRIVARIFVLSDVMTFLVQGSGGGFEDSTSQSSILLGQRILIGGLGLQTLSYSIFITLLMHSHRCFRKDQKIDNDTFPWRVIYFLYFSSVFIIIRSIYRLLEFAIGNGDGFLTIHEAFFYCFDTLPLFLATVIHAVYWPKNLIYSSRGDELSELGTLANSEDA
ncbi:hypothetical protein M0805_006863 [Coniferiporia weirii]|nr:hypothetical protein M0805_006863 [Coniferiporia weirii]